MLNRHHHVCDDDVRLILLEHMQGFLSVLGEHDVEHVLEPVLHVVADVFVVFCNQKPATLLVIDFRRVFVRPVCIGDIHFRCIAGVYLVAVRISEFLSRICAQLKRQEDGEGRSFSFFASETYLAVVQLHQSLYE